MPSEQKSKSACSGCRWTMNCLNGLYCKRLKRYVEYATQQPCLRHI
ncbi:MAG: hypothetical protein SPF56_08470 [Bacteroidaceae bacterium]|nr:hypothetical protein [Bacteroidaceae bacterium]